MESADLQPDVLERIDRQHAYNDEDWAASAGHRPLEDLTIDDLLGLVTHWGWTNAARGWFYTLMELEGETGRDAEKAGLHEPWAGAMFVYYSLLWAVIERVRKLRVPIHGPLKRDIRAIAEDLRTCRNAVFHVGRPADDRLYDERLDAIMGDTGRQRSIDAVHLGFGRAIAEESLLRRDRPASGAAPDALSGS